MTDAAGRHEQPAGAIRVTVAGPVTGPATRERRDRGDRAETGDGSYFAPLARARYLLLTTFRQKGTPVSAVVQGVADGDRAYFRVRSRSGTARRLRHTDGVQVAPCSALGLWSYGPPLDAAVRPLAGEEASRVAGQAGPHVPGPAPFPGLAGAPGLAPAAGVLRAPITSLSAGPPVPETARIARPGRVVARAAVWVELRDAAWWGVAPDATVRRSNGGRGRLTMNPRADHGVGRRCHRGHALRADRRQRLHRHLGQQWRHRHRHRCPDVACRRPGARLGWYTRQAHTTVTGSTADRFLRRCPHRAAGPGSGAGAGRSSRRPGTWRTAT